MNIDAMLLAVSSGAMDDVWDFPKMLQKLSYHPAKLLYMSFMITRHRHVRTHRLCVCATAEMQWPSRRTAMAERLS